MLEVVSFGESMLRLSPPVGESLENAQSLRMWCAGAESNMLIALQRLGRKTGWVSRLPATPLGRLVAAEIARHGVDVSGVVWAEGERLGVNFLELGIQPRPHQVFYDRHPSAFSTLDPAEIDYSYLSSTKMLHLSGITPALSPACRQAWHTAAHTAKEQGVTVVLDANHRAKLWSVEEAQSTLRSIFPVIDVFLCALRDARTLFAEDPSASPESLAHYLLDISAAKVVVLTEGQLGAMAVSRADPQKIWREAGYPVDIVDRIGAGDAFAAGFLDAWLAEKPNVGLALRQGNAMAALKMTFRGDTSWATAQDLHSLLENPQGLATAVKR